LLKILPVKIQGFLVVLQPEPERAKQDVETVANAKFPPISYLAENVANANGGKKKRNYISPVL
jgi:hypothetical protein